MLNSPQCHRLHHSSLAEHHDRNFAALLPIFDVIYRTHPRPASTLPPTGLSDGEIPHGKVEAMIWPIRGAYRRAALDRRIDRGCPP